PGAAPLGRERPHPKNGSAYGADSFVDQAQAPGNAQLGGTSENGIYGHSRFCNTDFDDKLACLNLSGV
ncbi:hypothetical protein EYT36_24120, partial [Salmonella enterica]|nr:hypothetical protein [Salmonella enterica]EFV8985679.1 hypothetical protein [Shigella sonnei]